MTNWIFIDGDCQMCRRMAHWAKRHDRRGLLHIVPYQDAPSPPMTPDLAETCAHAMHVLTHDGRLMRGGQAALWVLERIGWRRLARLMALFGPLVEVGYRLVAANRSRIGRWVLPHEPPL